MAAPSAPARHDDSQDGSRRILRATRYVRVPRFTLVPPASVKVGSLQSRAWTMPVRCCSTLQRAVENRPSGGQINRNRDTWERLVGLDLRAHQGRLACPRSCTPPLLNDRRIA